MLSLEIIFVNIFCCVIIYQIHKIRAHFTLCYHKKAIAILVWKVGRALVHSRRLYCYDSLTQEIFTALHNISRMKPFIGWHFFSHLFFVIFVVADVVDNIVSLYHQKHKISLKTIPNRPEWRTWILFLLFLYAIILDIYTHTHSHNIHTNIK